VIKVVVLGQPYWGIRIAQELDGCAPDVAAVFVPARGYPRLLVSRPGKDRVILIRAGFRVGATTRRGRFFDMYWSLLRRAMPRAARCHYWLGTDVLNTVEEFEAGTIRRGALASSRDDLHLADARWLADELTTVGLHASVAHVPQPYRAPEAVPPLPDRFSVLTYLSADRFEFYGGDAILDAARRMPDVRFDVVGRTGDPTGSAPPNVRWHGWVADIQPFYADATVVVRIPRHDGLGATVIEALLNARYVVYTHEVPFVRTIAPATGDKLFEALDAFRAEASAGRLGPNLEGRDYAAATFEEKALVDGLMTHLRSAL
jgi:Glycosyl transferases group 1